MSFGKRLAALRKRLGMTQAELGLELGTDGKHASKSVVYGWEKDQHYPRVDQLILICKKLHCSADHLLFGGAPPMASAAFIEAQQALAKLSGSERIKLLADAQAPAALDDAGVEDRFPVTKVLKSKK